MSVQFFTTPALAALKSGVTVNQAAYLEGRAGNLLTLLGENAVNVSRISAGEPPSLKLPKGEDKFDGENIRLVHRWLGHLTPVQAADPRLWVYLCHADYAAYTAVRWPVASDAKVVDRVRERYFMDGEGLASITRNSIARLWWFGHLTHRANLPDHYELADVLVSLQDIQMAFMERSIGRSCGVIQSVLRVWKDNASQKGSPARAGDVIKRWAKLIRLHGAVVVLDSLPAEKIEHIVKLKLQEALADT